MGVLKARLRIHDVTYGLLLVEPGSALALYEFEIPNLVHCGIVSRGPLMGSTTGATAAMQMVATSRQVMEGDVTGGHC